MLAPATLLGVLVASYGSSDDNPAAGSLASSQSMVPAGQAQVLGGAGC